MASPSEHATILVVEDDRPLREFYRTTLRFAGYTVVAVEDGMDALRWLEAERPAAILLDLSLIRLSGRDLLSELRARDATRHIPVVVVTGERRTSNLTDSDIVCVLRKPVTGGALSDAVERCLKLNL